MNSLITKRCSPIEEAIYQDGFQAGAASRDAYIERLETGLLQVRKALCGDIHNTDDLLDLIASRDVEIAELKDALGYDWDKYKASQMALRECMQMVVEQDAKIAELVGALKPFGAIDLVESWLPAEFAMLILRARAALAAAKTQGYSE